MLFKKKKNTPVVKKLWCTVTNNQKLVGSSNLNKLKENLLRHAHLYDMIYVMMKCLKLIIHVFEKGKVSNKDLELSP